MKKFIFGITLMLIGFLGVALFTSMALASPYTINDSNKFSDIWRLYKVTPIVHTYFFAGVAGLIITIVSLFEKRNK